MGHILRSDDGHSDPALPEGIKIPEPSFYLETGAKSLAAPIFLQYGVNEDLLPHFKIYLGCQTFRKRTKGIFEEHLRESD